MSDQKKNTTGQSSSSPFESNNNSIASSNIQSNMLNNDFTGHSGMGSLLDEKKDKTNKKTPRIRVGTIGTSTGNLILYSIFYTHIFQFIKIINYIIFAYFASVCRVVWGVGSPQ